MNTVGDGTNPTKGVNYELNPVVLRRTYGKGRNDNEAYSDFVRIGRAVFFTDAQIDFLWDYMEWFKIK